MRKPALYLVACLLGIGALGVWVLGLGGASGSGGAVGPSATSEAPGLRQEPALMKPSLPNAPAGRRVPQAAALAARGLVDVGVTVKIVSSSAASVPIAGVELQLWVLDEESYLEEGWEPFFARPTASARTDAQGIARLPLRGPSGYYCRIADPKLCLVGDAMLRISPGAHSFTLAATRAVPLHGRILSTENSLRGELGEWLGGLPVEGALVYVTQNTWVIFGRSPPQGERPDVFAPTNLLTARTDRDGYYTIGGFLPRSGVQVGACAPGHAGAESVEFTAEFGEAVEVPDIVLGEVGGLLLTVRSRQGPVPGAYVNVYSERDLLERVVRYTADGLGRLVVTGLPPGATHITSGTPGFAETVTESFPVIPGLVRRDIVLERGVTLNGRVRGTDEAPVEGALVTLTEEQRSRSVRCDAAGEFQFPDVCSTHPATLEVEARDFLPASSKVAVGAARQFREVSLRRGGSLELEVRSAAGELVESFELLSPNPQGEQFSQARKFSGPRPALIQGLKQGRCDVVVRAGAEVGWVRDFTLTGQPGARLRVELEPLHTLRGKLVDGFTGGPLAGVLVSCEPESLFPLDWTLTDSAGRYELRVFDGGVLNFSRAGYEGGTYELPLKSTVTVIHPSSGAEGPWWLDAAGSGAGR